MNTEFSISCNCPPPHLPFSATMASSHTPYFALSTPPAPPLIPVPSPCCTHISTPSPNPTLFQVYTLDDTGVMYKTLSHPYSTSYKRWRNVTLPDLHISVRKQVCVCVLRNVLAFTLCIRLIHLYVFIHRLMQIIPALIYWHILVTCTSKRLEFSDY